MTPLARRSRRATRRPAARAATSSAGERPWASATPSEGRSGLRRGEPQGAGLELGSGTADRAGSPRRGSTQRPPTPGSASSLASASSASPTPGVEPGQAPARRAARSRGRASRSAASRRSSASTRSAETVPRSASRQQLARSPARARSRGGPRSGRRAGRASGRRRTSPGAARAAAPRARSSSAAVRVEQLAARRRAARAIALTVKSRRARSSLERRRARPPAARPGARSVSARVEARSTRSRRRRPWRCRSARARRVGAEAARERRRRRPRPPTSRSGCSAAEQQVADGAADQVGAARRRARRAARASPAAPRQALRRSSAGSMFSRLGLPSQRVARVASPTMTAPRVMGRIARASGAPGASAAGCDHRRRVAALAAAGRRRAAYELLEARRATSRTRTSSSTAASGRRRSRGRPKDTTVDWPAYGYNDQRTRYLPTDVVQPPFDSSDWSYQAGKLLEFSPIVVDDRLYFIDNDAPLLRARRRTGKVDLEAGRRAERLLARVRGRPAVRRHLEPGQAFALRARNGKVLWERPLPGRSETSPLAYSDKLVIFGCECGTVFALDLKDGEDRVDGRHRRRDQGRRSPSATGSSTSATTPARCSRSTPRTAASEWQIEHERRQLRPRRRHLLDPGRRLRPRLRRQHRLAASTASTRTRARSPGRSRPALRSIRPGGRRHRARPGRPSTSAPPTTTSTRSTPRPATSAGEDTGGDVTRRRAP